MNTQGRNAYDSSALNSVLETNTLGNWRKVNFIRGKYNKQPDAQQRQPLPTITTKKNQKPFQVGLRRQQQ